MASLPFDELVPVPRSGRVFYARRRPGLADCAPSGRLRLDAIARWLQDVAYADVDDAGVAGAAFWILRRTRIHVHRFPQINEPCEMVTFCSGVGRLVAERRTNITVPGPDGSADVLVEAGALWVHLDPLTHRPSNVSAAELEIFAAAGYGARRVSHRLRHPRPDPAAARPVLDWHFRRVDTDVADHVNNAAYWELLEEELLAGTSPETMINVEIEFREGAQPGSAALVADGDQRRAILDGSGDLLATVALGDLR